ncbi:MAG: hypothetical protein Q4D54_10845 [Eubacteriales bacterium]|nr:hypothetical protein [Eubacteriales bacterium]
MKKIINTFKYGSGETKRLLAVTLLAGIVAFALAIAAVVLQSLLFFFEQSFVYVRIIMIKLIQERFEKTCCIF